MSDGPRWTPPPGWYDDPAGGVGLRWWDGALWTEHVVWRPMIGQVKSARQHTLTILAIVLSVLGAMMMLTFLIAAMGYSEPKNGEPPMEPGPGWPFVVAYSGVVILIAAVVCFRIGRHR